MLIKMFDSAGYENVLYAMIFAPIAIILFICILGSMFYVLNRKRYVFCKLFVPVASINIIIYMVIKA